MESGESMSEALPSFVERCWICQAPLVEVDATQGECECETPPTVAVCPCCDVGEDTCPHSDGEW